MSDSDREFAKGLAELFEKCPSVLMDNDKDHSFFLTDVQRAAVIIALHNYARPEVGDRWIPVSEREPREEEYPVVCLDNEDQPFTASSHASLTCYSARYWMPLPIIPPQSHQHGDK